MAKRALKVGMLALSFLAGLAGCPSQQIHIDWINFVRFQGITYVGVNQVGRELQSTDLGAQFATVRFRLSGNVNDPNYQTQDGYAAYLDPGTPVYRVQGYAETFRLAAYQGGRLILFEADTNPRAKIGADLLDIGGKVRSITVVDNSGAATIPLATLRDERQVITLVTELLAAPVDQSLLPADNGPHYDLTFHLADGTQVVRAYSPQSRVVFRGIVVPQSFVSTIAAAIGK